MANIINIETSSKICSVAWTKDGAIEFQLDCEEGMNHAVKLAPFVERTLQEMERRVEKPEAVAVSMGPGSYTGLRIGLSLAKGLAFSRDIPLIGVSTLKILAVKTMFRSMDWTGDEILVPMIDARRMEVYTCAYNFALEELMTPGPLILDADSYADILDSGRRVVFMGDGSDKFKPLVSERDNVVFIDGVVPYAKDMTALSEKAFRENDFIDVAYSVPEYLKEYQTTVSRKNKYC